MPGAEVGSSASSRASTTSRSTRFLFPLDALHPQAAAKSERVLCAADRAAARQAYVQSGQVPEARGDCAPKLAELRALGRTFRVTGTPWSCPPTARSSRS